MPLKCVFHVPGESPSCHVLQALGYKAPSKAICQRLADTYCRNGRYLCCPIFERVEKGLSEAHRRLKVRAFVAA